MLVGSCIIWVCVSSKSSYEHDGRDSWNLGVGGMYDDGLHIHLAHDVSTSGNFEDALINLHARAKFRNRKAE